MQWQDPSINIANQFPAEELSEGRFRNKLISLISIGFGGITSRERKRRTQCPVAATIFLLPFIIIRSHMFRVPARRLGLGRG